MDKLQAVVRNYDNTLAEVSELSKGEATLVLASKTVEQEVLHGLAAGRPGVILGENRVQELLSKYFTCEGLTWHFIGRLQTNKVKYIVDKVSLIQSVDSLRLAEEIEKRSAKIGKRMDILLEVNVGGEESKGGVSEAEFLPLLEEIKKMPHLRLKGIMSVLPAAEEGVLAPLYDKLKALFEQAKSIKGDNFDIRYLSAGMSGDYRFALLHGSNMVRIGSAVFGARHYAQ
ncbi:MAG TPA: YggS family pyridoxal phosphate-dependent enzyme [Clostridiales bacterium]|nr:YggS family pyridoxal phosphate-dependent enzyme [Clostridiales bacterium]